MGKAINTASSKPLLSKTFFHVSVNDINANFESKVSVQYRSHFLRPRYTAMLVKMSGLQDKIDNIEETLKSYEAEIPIIVEKGIDIGNVLINEQFIDKKYNESLKNELLNNITS